METMSARVGVAGIVAAVAVLVAGATSGGAAGQAERLRTFSGCPAFLDHVRARALPLVGPWGLGGGGFVVAMPSAARAGDLGGATGAGVEFSGTNVQEEGVDEPDLTKTDGRTLFVVGERAAERRRRAAAEPAAPRHAPARAGLVARAAAARHAGPRPLAGLAGRGARRPHRASSLRGRTRRRTTVTEVDARDPARLRRRADARARGRLLTARLVGRAVRLVLSSPLGTDLPFVGPTHGGNEAQAAERNRAVVRAATARRWLPGTPCAGAARRSRAARSSAAVRPPPARYSGLGLVTVLTIDPDRGLDPVDADAIVSDGRTVYASPTSLYVASERWTALRTGSGTLTDTTTAIHRFDIASPTADALRGERLGAGLPAQPVVALRARRRPARRDHRDARRGGAGRAARAQSCHGARRAGRRSSRSAASAASGRASGSTPCASSATPATSSPSARSTRSTRSTSPPRAARGARRAQDPRLLGLPAPRRRRPPARDRAGRDRRRQGARAPRPRSSTSPTCAARAGSTRSRWARRGRRRRGPPRVPLVAAHATRGDPAEQRRSAVRGRDRPAHRADDDRGGRSRVPSGRRGGRADPTHGRRRRRALHRLRHRCEGVVARDLRGARLRRAPGGRRRARACPCSLGRPQSASGVAAASSGGRSSRHVHCAGSCRRAAEELRAVPEAVALHLVVAHLDHELGSHCRLLELAAAPAVRLREAPLGRVLEQRQHVLRELVVTARARRRPSRRSRARRRRGRGRAGGSRSFPASPFQRTPDDDAVGVLLLLHLDHAVARARQVRRRRGAWRRRRRGRSPRSASQPRASSRSAARGERRNRRPSTRARPGAPRAALVHARARPRQDVEGDERRAGISAEAWDAALGRMQARLHRVEVEHPVATITISPSSAERGGSSSPSGRSSGK